MKQLLLSFIALLNITLITGQNETISRLRSRLSMETIDTAKCKILDSLSMYYMFFNNKSDSTLYYCNENINTAFPVHDKKYLVLAYARLSFYYNNTGRYKESLSMALKGLNLSEQYNINEYLSALYYDLTWAYFNLNDNNAGLNSAFKGISFLKFDKDPFFDQALHLYGNTGSGYLSIGKQDSALFYFKEMDSVAEVSKESGARVIADWYWSQYYLFYKKDYKKADSVITEGISQCIKNGEFLLNFFYIFSANSYLRQGRINDAIAQAREAYELSLPLTDPAGELDAASVLSRCYDESGNRDSAYHYLKLKDSLNNVLQEHSNAIEIQQVQFDEQLNNKEQEAVRVKNQTKLLTYIFITGLIFFIVIAAILWRNNRHRKKANSILQQQKEKVESTLSELKSTQTQLIQSEKMASLGELTAGIAHEIQNPLNFVNNFSEVSNELIEELKVKNEKLKIEDEEIKDLLNDIENNLEKINHHGKRADAIVKGMLQHSRSSSGKKEPTDINALCDEYLRLAYHGLRAKDKSFNAKFETNFDPSIDKINIAPQDIGRVILNLINNAFYAVKEKQKAESLTSNAVSYEPIVIVGTKKLKDKVAISVKDNGNGIPDSIKEKIFQPFFTTKPTGSGTGLGLSLSYDIVKAHGGELKVETKEGEGTIFIIQLSTN